MEVNGRRRLVAVDGLGAGRQRAGQLGKTPEAWMVVDEKAEERLIEAVLGSAGARRRVTLRMQRTGGWTGMERALASTR